MTVNVWTVNNPDEMLHYISQNVDLITTDHPDIGMRLTAYPFVTE